MSDAPTPPPHTPINFLKGGGNAVFSAKCIELLAKLNYEPSDFGSYKDVKKKCDAARKVVNDHANGKKDARPPTEREKWLAECQSGHMGQNACRQRSRNDACTNLVDGYSHDLAPCMPQHGQATDRDGNPRDTEHGFATADERAAPVSRLDENYQPRGREGKPERGPDGTVTNGSAPPAANCQYTQDEMREDDRARTKKFLNRHGNNRPAPTGTEGKQGANATGAAATASGKAGTTSGPGEKTGSKEKSPKPKEIKGETAAECLNNFKEMAEEAMKTKCKNDRKKNRRIANGGKNKTEEQGRKHPEKLKKDRDDKRAAAEQAKKDLQSKNRSVGQHRRRVAEAEARCKQDPSPENIAALAAANKKKDQAVADQKVARSALTKARGERNKASQAHNQARQAHCLAEQGDRIAAGQGRTTGRSPGVPSTAASGNPSLAIQPFGG